MRKLFWFGCAASVTAAAFVFVTARHAHKHPVSVAGHLVRGAQTAVSWSNPMLQGVRILGAQVAFTVGRTLATEATPATPPEAAPCCTSRAPRCEPIVCEIPQVIDLAKFEQLEAPTGRTLQHNPQYNVPGIDEELERELQLMEQQAAQLAPAPITVVVTAGEAEENEPVPAMMPAAQDEDIHQLQEVQDIEFWREFDGIPEPEAVEVEPLPMPRELEELPAATEGSTETDGVEPVEGTDGVEEGEAPDCKEMPEIDHHHSGCPSMGGCPYTGRCPPLPTYPTNKDRE